MPHRYKQTHGEIDKMVLNRLELETRGIDYKGNVRYFCPRCSVRYIGEIQTFFIHLKKYISIYHFRIQIS